MKIPLLIIAIFFVVGGLVSCGRENSTDLPELLIISPHGLPIRREFTQAFSRWHQKKYGTAVNIRWPVVGSGGTNDIRKNLEIVYGLRNQLSCGYDLMFGGGQGVFNGLVTLGALEPPAMTPGLTAALQTLPAEIQGAPLRGPQDLWIAATLSNFGFVVNKQRLEELHIPLPQTWEDLSGPQWFGELSLADPSKGASITTSFEMILQQYGWKTGWPILVRLFANAQNIQETGSMPAEETASGNAAAGIVIDFFGRTAIMKAGPSIIQFIIPRNGSPLSPDPVAVLKGSPHAELASHFVEFVISEDGQRLWVQRAGTPGGPAERALGRMAIFPAIYEKDIALLTDPTNPYAAMSSMRVDNTSMTLRSRFLGDLLKAALIDNHQSLRVARAAMIRAGEPPDLKAQFDALPFDADQTAAISQLWLTNSPQQARLKQEWREKYAATFEKIVGASSK